MRLQIILSVGIGLWIGVMLLVVALCRAAKRGDEAMDAALAGAIAAEGEPELTHSERFERPLRDLGLEEAATLLGVRPHMLLAWNVRYGFPTSDPSEPRYSRSEILALRDSLEDGVSIASAVVRARTLTKRRRAATTARLVDRRDGGVAS